MPSSCGQPMLPSVVITDFTPCRSNKTLIFRCTFGLSLTFVPTHRSKIGSAFSYLITAATIFVIVQSSGP